ncbi:DUF192 domain-containing protein [Rhizobium sp. TRM95111]|uniref:DUF192 domain-containing protein n=1 Tax=Rhizobium alarense TaxID=2846851 RepID=UPI001F3DDBE8|nr:DUF192 domain-containing protein [Rhizobium alarense]MCF3643228.1 DUF192 domain-containing protein [Rhizobium alarense]
MRAKAARFRYAVGVASLGLSLLTGVAYVTGTMPARASSINEACDLHFSNGVAFRGIPVARTTAQQARGLSHRDDAGPGMLFSWPTSEPRIFWMRDTRMPLSIAFFAEDGELFAIEDMQPNTDTYHYSLSPALDALELPQGQFARHGLPVGSRLLRRECYPTDSE